MLARLQTFPPSTKAEIARFPLTARPLPLPRDARMGDLLTYSTPKCLDSVDVDPVVGRAEVDVVADTDAVGNSIDGVVKLLNLYKLSMADNAVDGADRAGATRKTLGNDELIAILLVYISTTRVRRGVELPRPEGRIQPSPEIPNHNTELERGGAITAPLADREVHQVVVGVALMGDIEIRLWKVDRIGWICYIPEQNLISIADGEDVPL